MAASLSCRACQRRVIDACISFNGLSARTWSTVHGWRVAQATSTATVKQRQIHSRAALQQEQTTGPSIEDAREEPKLSDTKSSLPWYLQVEPPTPPISNTIHPFLAAQEVPPLPEDPPALLEPILKHLSIQIGLDHLTILDLRSLDPPSALGANLLMILGTARSTKHLNTSADRFCRWLRATYGLRPYADGLLGRNELKLKLRRKNRKIKLAQSVGNTTAVSSDYDDGIGTGWICCNIGSLDDATVPDNASRSADEAEAEISVFSARDQERILDDEEPEYKNPGSPPGESDFKYRGFGSESYAPRIVVQMFTEEKRFEMDLEGLWEARIVRRETKRARKDQEFQEAQLTGETEAAEENGNSSDQGKIEAAIRRAEQESNLLKDVAPVSAATGG